MKHFKTSILASAMYLTASSLCQTTSAQIHLTADLQNNHLWRGMEVADGCLILTDLSYTFGAGHATLGLWGGTNTQGNYKEFNHYVTLRGRRLRVLRYGHLQLLAGRYVQQPPILQL